PLSGDQRDLEHGGDQGEEKKDTDRNEVFGECRVLHPTRDQEARLVERDEAENPCDGQAKDRVCDVATALAGIAGNEVIEAVRQANESHRIESGEDQEELFVGAV